MKLIGLLLITIFGLSVTTGLMAEHVAPPPRIRRTLHIAKPLPEKHKVVVAVIDTGIDFNHPDLKGHEWVNPHEIAGNGIDDDDNGYVDDVHGYDFAARQGEVKDNHGHGTHIAGIIVKEAPDVQIMNLKYFDRGMDGAEALRNSLEAMRYAIKMKADIINYSGGGTVASPEELALLREASHRGILVVAAAGNESSNSERQPFYPANYNLSNIISVTAIDETSVADVILPSSNFGVRSVAVAAQGKDVRSTLPGGRYGLMTGTSQATAFVTATAVRILESEYVEGRVSTPEELIERIVGSSKHSEELQGKTRVGSKLAASQALAFRDEPESSQHKEERRQLVRLLRNELRTPAKVNPYGL